MSWKQSSLFGLVLYYVLCFHNTFTKTPLFVCLSSDPNALGQHGTDHALIGGVVAVVVFVTLCLIIVLGRYLARHKGKTTENWICLA